MRFFVIVVMFLFANIPVEENYALSEGYEVTSQ